jgi:hypothetical protein
MNKAAQKLGKQGGLKHDPLKTKATILKRYGVDFYKNAALRRKKYKSVREARECPNCRTILEHQQKCIKK